MSSRCSLLCRRALGAAAATGIVFLTACATGHEPPAPNTGRASVSLALVPTGQNCIVIQVVGPADAGAVTVTDPFSVAPQMSSVFALVGLPLGLDAFSAQSYAVPCSQMTGADTPSFFSNTVTADVTANPPVSVTLEMGGTTGEGTVSLTFPVPLGTITEYPIPTAASYPEGIATGSDGNLWFTESALTIEKIGRIALDGGVTEFSGLGFGSPFNIVAGPDGSLWVTQNASGDIGRITTSGVPTSFNNGSGESSEGIAAGWDGNLWSTEPVTNSISRTSTDGNNTVFDIPWGGQFGEPDGIAAGSDGSLWFTQGGIIGRITTDGGFSQFPIPTPNANASGIAPGSDGNLWFAESSTDKIGRIQVADGGITEFPVPTPGAGLLEVAAGPDGNVWFTEELGNNIGRITPSGTITEFPIPTPSSLPFGITAGPDGNVWFTEAAGNKIGRITTL
jgi:streptogramin lyase